MFTDQIAPGRAPGTSLPCPDDRIDLVHWWASRGEADAFGVLRRALERSGIACNDTPVSGGASMADQLETRLHQGDLPTATVLSGHGSGRWADMGVLGDLTALAAAEGWDRAIPQAVQGFCRANGKWFGVPAAIHSVNWLWINREVARKIGLARPPASLDELFAALEQARAAGFVPLAIGDQAWLAATILDSLMVAVNGYAFYQAALGDLDPTALHSVALVDAFRALARLGTLAPADTAPRDWSGATRMVAKGEALLEISGDWVRAELAASGAQPGIGYDCLRFPGTGDGVIFNADIIAMFAVAPDRQAAQATLARTVMDPAVQAAFSRAKGAAPARTDMPGPDLDPAVTAALADIRRAEQSGTLAGSMAHGYMQPATLQAAYTDIALQVFRARLTPERAASALAKRFAPTSGTGQAHPTTSKDLRHVDL